MTDLTRALLRYWHTSIQDSNSFPGTAAKLDAGWPCALDSLKNGRLDEQALETWRRKLDEAHKESGELAVIPLAYQKRLQSGGRAGYAKNFLFPLYLPCEADRDGLLTPRENAYPVIPRDLLEPQEATVAGITIGDTATLDQAVEKNLQQGAPVSWTDYLESGTRILRAVAPELEAVLAAQGYRPLENALLVGACPVDAARHIASLYAALLSGSHTSELPLLEAFCRAEGAGRHPAPPEHSFTARLGYPNREHSLADNQRLAAACVLRLREGEILAVNGPPGTGKTAALLSFIATETVRAVLEGAEHPPLIVAASTNNQAVTNILDDFARIPADEGLYCRWIPWVRSFGSYFPAKNKKEEAEQQGRQTDIFFEKCREPESLRQAEEELLRRAEAYAGRPLPLADVPAFLKEELAARHRQLTDIEQTHARLAASRTRLGDLATLPDDALQALRAGAVCFLDMWKHTLEERGLWEKLFFFLPGIKNRVGKRLANVYAEHWPEALRAALPCPAGADIPPAFQEEADAVRIALHQCLGARAAYRGALARGLGRDASDAPLSLAGADRLLDATLRRSLFWLAVHYWEAVWIGKARQGHAKNWPTIPSELPKEWQMRMMLTPCAVATFFMAPKVFRQAGRLGRAIDLLIADEAGQVSPEVAAPTFALARRAVVVGDDKQIPPVWGVPAGVDFANAATAGLNKERLVDKGQAASCGSLMRVAQAASAFTHNFAGQGDTARGLGKGLYLVEHRRCITPIIQYCNTLCYEGILVPKNDGAPLTDIPPFLGVHVAGTVERTRGGSRCNRKEAERVANWLADKREALGRAYGGKELRDIVGVITPFKAQIALIKDALANRGINGVTVGTIHALQGAERPLVLFSPVCTAADAGRRLFFNQSPNMLNVAVSRAKHNFIVVGDMRLLPQVDPTSPYGMLADYLRFEPVESPLGEVFPPDLRPFRLLAGPLHDRFLQEAFVHTRSTLFISSPWVTENIVRSLQTAIQSCVARGVTVCVLADREKCAVGGKLEACALLQRMGVQVLLGTRLHAKALYCDGELAVMGSFNWLSANRGTYRQAERSFLHVPDNAVEEILNLCAECGVNTEIRHKLEAYFRNSPKLAV